MTFAISVPASFASRMFDGFRSRWTTFCACTTLEREDHLAREPPRALDRGARGRALRQDAARGSAR